MYQRNVLDIEDALRAVDAALGATSDTHMAVAVVDDQGDLVAYARTDETPVFYRKDAILRAFTASRVRSDLSDFALDCSVRGMSAADFGQGMISAKGGAVVVRDDASSVIGAIGVSGPGSETEEALARLALEALMKGQRE